MVNDMKLPLKKRTDWSNYWVARGVFTDLVSSKPFVINNKAKLVHRPKAISIHGKMRRTGEWHYGMDFYCGGGVSGTSEKLTLSDDPGESVVCEKCEVAATYAGLPSSESILGRHVCIGGVKAVKSCCTRRD